MPRILHIVENLGPLSETFVTDLVFDLATLCPDYTLACSWQGDQSDSIPPEVQVYTTDYAAPLSRLQRFSLRLRQFLRNDSDQARWKIRQHLAVHRLEVVLDDFKPHVVLIEFATAAALLHPALINRQIPFVIHVHGFDITATLRLPIFRESLQQLFKTASAFITASEHMRRLLVLEGAKKDSIHVINYGINTGDLLPIPFEERTQNSSPSAVSLGRLTPKKNPVALVEAFAIVHRMRPDARLTIIGDGEELPRVKERIRRLHLEEAVHLAGALPRGEALKKVREHWVFLQHSVTPASGDQEGFGISMAEAAALELPVVATRHDGIPEHVLDGKTGLLVQEYDYEDMARCILRLFENPGEAAAMGVAGRKNIAEICQAPVRAERICQLLESVASPSDK